MSLCSSTHSNKRCFSQWATLSEIYIDGFSGPPLGPIEMGWKPSIIMTAVFGDYPGVLPNK